MGIFWVADYDSEVRIGKFKIWSQNCKNQNGGSKIAAILVQIRIFSQLRRNLVYGGFRDADYESGVGIVKFKMED